MLGRFSPRRFFSAQIQDTCLATLAKSPPLRNTW